MTSPLDMPDTESTRNELRQRIRTTPLLPYEQWNGSPLSTILGNAQRILSEGWARSNHPPLKLSGPFPWDEFVPTSRSWNFLLNSFDLIDSILSAHSATGEAQYLEPAVTVALDWIDKHPCTEGSSAPHAWYDMAVGMRAYKLAYILDAAAREDWVTDEQLARLQAGLELHRSELADDSKIAFHSNHGFYQIAGQLAMARRFGAFSEAMRASREQAQTRIVVMLERQFSDEGVHNEHSPDYHRMVADTLKGMVDAGLLDSADVIEREEQIERSLSWFIMPNGYIANFGDSDYRLCTRGQRAAIAKWRTEEMRFVATLGEVGTRPAQAARGFAKSGYFIVRGPAEPGSEYSQAAYLAQTAAFHSRTHKHADDLSFIWYDRGAQLLVDAGRYGYVGKTEQGSELWKDGFWYADPNRVYCESTRAHNTVEIDGRNYQRKGVKPYGSALNRFGSVNDELFYSECEVKHFKSIRHVRLLIFKPSHWLIVCDWLHDNVEAEHDYRQWFHFAPELAVTQEGAQYVATGARPQEALRATSLLAAPQGSKLSLAQATPELQGWWSPSDGKMLPNYALSFDLRARTGLFATLFSFANELRPHASSRMAASGRNGYLRWHADGVDQTLAFSRPEEGDMTLVYERGKGDAD